jgi:hypothetical protein
VQVYLEHTESAAIFFWAIKINDRIVYKMHPNPADSDYNSFPNIDGAWYAVDFNPGEQRSRKVSNICS